MRLFVRLLAVCIVMSLITAACSSAPGTTFADLPAGHAEQGAQLFSHSINGAPACATCHTVDGQPLVGPSFQGFPARAQSRQAGQSSQEYAYTSITQPAAYVVGGFGNLMYNQYSRQLSSQQIADLIAYLLTL